VFAVLVDAHGAPGKQRRKGPFAGIRLVPPPGVPDQADPSTE